MNNGLSLKDIDPNSLSDLKNIEIDCDLPIIERIRAFVTKVKSPYMFQVNGNVVKIVFNKGSTISFEDGLTKAITNIISANS